MAQDNGIVQIAGGPKAVYAGDCVGGNQASPCSYHAIGARRTMPGGGGRALVVLHISGR